MKKIASLAVVWFLLVFSGPINLLAQDPAKYPDRPVTLQHAFAAGGSTDLTGRAVAAISPKYFSQPIIVTPKPGGAGLLALQNLLSSKPDGHTLHLGRPSEMSIGPFIENMPFDMERDFIPIGQVAQDRIIFSVNSKTPWKTIEDLIAAAKKEPEKIKYACSSPTATVRLGMEKFLYEAGIKLTCVPFKGSAPAAIAVAGGHIQVLTSATSEALPHVQRGDLRVLLTCADVRSKQLPDVPTGKEKGFDVNFPIWHTIFAPKGSPPAILAKVEAMLKNVAEDKEFLAALIKLDSEPGFITAKDFAAYWTKERKWIGEVVKKIGLAKKP
jgi:tripartite-type tricarboxylate transporter receptor subunit TctC